MFADNTVGDAAPMLVHRDDLALANARLQTGFITLNQLAGPPIGAALFAAGRAWPFAGPGRAGRRRRAAGVAGRAAAPRPRTTEAGRQSAPRDRRGVPRGRVHHAAVRTLVLTILIFNVTFGAAWSVLVLYATQRLGLGAIGFGLLTTVSAVGGLLGTVALRLDHPPGQPGQHHAGRADHRDAHPPRRSP